MDKLSVSYYLSGSLVSKIDERGHYKSNRSAQLSEDLSQFYDMLDFGIQNAMHELAPNEMQLIIRAISKRARKELPSLTTAKPALLDSLSRLDVNADAIKSKIRQLDNITCYALLDWARANS